MEHLKSFRLILAAAAIALPACVTSPNWGDAPSSRRDPIDFTGMASRANAPLRVQAWNYATGAFDTVRTFTGSATQTATSPDLFGWQTNGVFLPDRYWSPGDCTSSGMANLRVLEVNTDGTTSELSTFTDAGMDCVDDHLIAGDHPVAAGYACRMPDPRIVLFTPPQCRLPATTDATAPRLTVRLTDPTRVWQATTGNADLNASGISRTSTLTAMAMARDPDSAVAQVRLIVDLNLQCRTTTGTIALTPRGFVETRTQTVVATSLAQIGLDATRGINIASVVGSCAPGTTFERLDAAVIADGINGVGGTTTSPVIRFTVR